MAAKGSTASAKGDRGSAGKQQQASAKTKGAHHQMPVIDMITAMFVYYGWGIFIFIGHVRDFFRGIFYTTDRSPPGYAPIVSDFEDFYTRRAFGRIRECWDRSIISAPAAHVTVVGRERVPNFFPGYTKGLRETGYAHDCLNLGSYNYLGFGNSDSPTKGPVLEALDKYGVSMCSPRSDAGTTPLHQELERVVARYVGKESAMIFGMGFGTNSTALPALMGPGTLLISDELNHASIVVGARSSGAKIAVFKHSDVNDLERVIRKAIVDGQPRTHRPWRRILIVVEGIYSMEGEMCPLAEIVALKKKYKCFLYVDEAHSIGAVGPTGKGVCEFTGVDPADVDILMGTFTKSFGSVGGYIAGDTRVIEYLRYHCMGSVYSPAISPPACQQITSAMRIILGEDGTNDGKKRLESIYNNANFFRGKLREYGFHVLGETGSPVVPVMLYIPSTIRQFSLEALARNLAVVVVGFPATPLLLSRVRFCVSAAHTIEDLAEAAEKIKEIGDLLGIRYNKGMCP